jgi:hypothetical protein
MRVVFLFVAFLAMALSAAVAQTPEPPLQWRALATHEPWRAAVVQLPINYYDGLPGQDPFGSSPVACGYSGTYAALLKSDDKTLTVAVIHPRSKEIERISIPFSPRMEPVLPSADGSVGPGTSVMVGFRADKHVVYAACSEDASRLLLIEHMRIVEMDGNVFKKASVMLAYGMVDVRARTLTFLGVAALPGIPTFGSFAVAESNSTDEDTVVRGNLADVTLRSVVAPRSMAATLTSHGLSVVPLETVLDEMRRATQFDGTQRRPVSWAIHKTENATRVMFGFWDKTDEASTCELAQYGSGLFELGDAETQGAACTFGMALFERLMPSVRPSRSVVAAFKDGNLCQKGRDAFESRPLFPGTIDGLERGGLGRCRITALPMVRGEAFSPAGRNQWVAVTQGAGAARLAGDEWDRRDITERIGLALAGGDGSQPITTSPRAENSFSRCSELEAPSPAEHAFFCNEGWFIHVERDVAIR